jgi:hypothetical protein
VRTLLVVAVLAATASARAENAETNAAFNRLRWEINVGGAAYFSHAFEGGGPYLALGARDHRVAVMADYRQLYGGSSVVFHRFGIAARYNFVTCCEHDGIKYYESGQIFVEVGGAIGPIEGTGLRGDAQIALGFFAWPFRTKGGKNVHYGWRLAAVFDRPPHNADVFANAGFMWSMSVSIGN